MRRQQASSIARFPRLCWPLAPEATAKEGVPAADPVDRARRWEAARVFRSFREEEWFVLLEVVILAKELLQIGF
ncbi:unnamed protein product [Urochloa humidicola]